MGILQKKRRTTAQKGPGGQGKSWPKYRYCFSCLKVRGGSLPSKSGKGQRDSWCLIFLLKGSKGHMRKGRREKHPKTPWKHMKLPENTLETPWKHPENTLKNPEVHDIQYFFPYALSGYALCTFPILEHLTNRIEHVLLTCWVQVLEFLQCLRL